MAHGQISLEIVKHVKYFPESETIFLKPMNTILLNRQSLSGTHFHFNEIESQKNLQEFPSSYNKHEKDIAI